MVAEYTSSYILAGSTSAIKTGPLRVNDRPCNGLWRTVAKGRNFESSGRASKVHQETLCSIRAFVLCKFAGWTVWNFRFGDIPQAQVFFLRAPCRPWRGRPHLRWPWTLWAPKTPALLPMAQWPEALKATTISTVEQMTSQSRWTPRLFLLKKKKVRSHHREKERKKESKRENEWKKENKKSNNN